MSKNKRKNHYKRFDTLICNYDYTYPQLTHTELASKMLEEKDEINMSHKTLRMRISDWRVESKLYTKKIIEESSKHEYVPEPPVFNPDGVDTIRDIQSDNTIKDYSIIGGSKGYIVQDPVQAAKDLSVEEINRLLTPFGQIPVLDNTESLVDALKPWAEMINEQQRLDSLGKTPASGLDAYIDTPQGRVGGSVAPDWKPQPGIGLRAQIPEYNKIKSSKARLYTGSMQPYLEKTYVISGCWHFPFHNEQMFSAYLKLLQYLTEQRILTGNLLIGDIIDNHSISRHAKGKITIPGLTLSKEYQDTNKILDMIDQSTDGLVIEKEYLYGNHEMWYYQHMKEVDNAKLGEDVIKSPKEALKLTERGYTVQTDYANANLRLGKDLEAIHGDYVNTHAAHAHLQKMKRSVIFVHTHRLSRFDEGPLEGHNIGWGGDKNKKVFSYMTRVQKEAWKNGFAVVKIDTKGYSHVNQITWRHNGFYYDGKYFTA